MLRPHSSRSDGSDGEGDTSSEHEAEYQKLQRELRVLENDRKAYSQESQDQIKRQNATMHKLEQEHEELKNRLKVIESKSNQTNNEKQCENLEELGKKKKDVEKEIEEEKEKQKVLDAQIREMEKKVREKNSKQAAGLISGPKKDNQVKRKNRKLEDQLQLSNNKFGKALELNKELRNEIDNLRVERQRFDNLYTKLEKEKLDFQQETAEVINQSTQAYDQRVEAQEKMVLLREKAEKDVALHNAEMKELIRIIDHDQKLREFMNTKGKERDEDRQLVTWRERKEAMTAEKKKASQADSVESYESAFIRIKEITQEEDINKIVNQFIEVEDQNFALFNFVNDQNNQIEMLQEQIEQIGGKTGSFHGQRIELESEREGILKRLEERQRQASMQADECDSRHMELNKVMDQLKSGISSLFSKIGCKRSAIDDMLGANEGITDQNLLQYLGLIEERTNELLLTQAYVVKQTDYEHFTRHQPTLLGEGPQSQHSAPLIQPPAVGDDFDHTSSSDDDDDDDNRPLTKEELLRRAMKSVRKRESVIKKSGHQYDHSTDKSGRGTSGEQGGGGEKTKKKEKHSKMAK